MKISVCMATYNGGKYIFEQLASILPQLNAEDEIVISDDGSSDDTLKIIGDFKDERIRIVHGKKAGPVVNFENALTHSTGEVIFLSDQDDVWEPEKVKVMLTALQTADLVVSDCSITDGDLNVLEPSLYAVNKSGPGIIHNTIKNSFLGCCMAFNRKVLSRALPFPSGIPMHDIWIGMVGNLFFIVKFIPEKLVKYRRHGGNSVQWKEGITSVYSLNQKLRFRYIVLKNLFLLKIRESR